MTQIGTDEDERVAAFLLMFAVAAWGAWTTTRTLHDTNLLGMMVENAR